MGRELYIGGNLIDLDEKTVVAISFKAHDLTDLQSRNGVRSNKFKLPTTAHNNAALGYAVAPVSSSVKPYRKLAAKYVEDGVELISNGYAILEGVQGESYEATIYGGNIDFFSLIEGLKLSDLDLSAYDHDYDFATIQATWPNTTGFKYPLIDYGYLEVPIGSPAPEVRVDAFRPAFFVDTLLRKIFSEQDYEVAGDILERPDYLKEMLLFATESNDALFESSYGTEIIYEEWSTLDTVVGSPLAWVNVFDSIPSGNVDIHAYLKISISNTDPFAPDKWVKVYVADFFTATYTLVGTVSGNGTHTISADVLNAARGYQYALVFFIKGCWAEILEGRFYGESVDEPETYFFSAGVPRSEIYQTGGVEKYVWAGLVESLSLYFETKDLQNAAPDMLQKDFLLGIMNQYCLFPITDSLKREVTLVSLAKVVENKRRSRDWTSKLQDKKETFGTSFRKGSFAQNNYFEYIEDGSDPDATPNLGRGVLVIDDETLPKEKTLVQLPFAATVMARRFGTLDFALIRMLEDEVFSNSVAPRVLVDNTQDTPFTITFADGDTSSTSTDTNIPLCYFQLLSKTFNLGFDSSLLADNYSEFAVMVDKMKVLLRVFDLSLPDVTRFDFSRPSFLDQYAANYYVNSINNFKKGKLTTVELIEI